MGRVGLATNELEIDNQILNASGNLFDSVSGSGSAGLVSIKKIGQVTGIRLDQRIVGAIQVVWTKVPLAQSYEIQVGVDKTFILDRFETYNVGPQDTVWTYVNGDADRVYYVRIRARNSEGDVGDWSGTLNTRTGYVEANHLIGGSTGSLQTYTITDFKVTQNPVFPFEWASTLGYGYVWLPLKPPGASAWIPYVRDYFTDAIQFQSVGGTIFIFVSVDMSTAFSYVNDTGYIGFPLGQYLIMEFWLNGEYIDRNVVGRLHDYQESRNCTSSTSALMMGLPLLPGVGIHDLNIRIVLSEVDVTAPDGSAIPTYSTGAAIIFAANLTKMTIAIFEKVR